MGTPDFAGASLKALVDAGKNVVAVVTTPDKPAGRGQKIQMSTVKEYALSLNLPVLQPEKLKDEDFLAELRSFNAELFVVVAFRMLPEVVWSMPVMGTINLHASLLPQYRGAAPIQWAIMNGETVTGVTTFFIEKEIDTGKIISSKKVVIDHNDTGGTLHDKLMNTGAALITETVTDIENGTYNSVSQQGFTNDSEELKPAPKIFKEDCKINWVLNSGRVLNFIRALSPYPVAWTYIQNAKGQKFMLRIFNAIHYNETTTASALPLCHGRIFTDGKETLCISTADGWLKITELQLEGKKRMATSDFIRGIADISDWTICND